MSDVTTSADATKSAPVKAVWALLIVAWICFLLPVPGIGLFVGCPLNFVAFIVAIVVITRGRTGMGITQLIVSLVVSPIIYFIGLAIFGAAMNSGQQEKESFDYGQVPPAYVQSIA
ncbi:hypothetical protein [Salinicola acroporae]|uniref:Uncharacterized protein n=1 Tax=Salinicola acroporae TaxID=1541440 RepID=A0ABT6I0T0_9GAMM|nr:hypothetical protein [Salinicola acroporae]MDH4571122.1 hypothetical protein [Salinicola acroporae]